jgi:hypothetical protein
MGENVPGQRRHKGGWELWRPHPAGTFRLAEKGRGARRRWCLRYPGREGFKGSQERVMSWCCRFAPRSPVWCSGLSPLQSPLDKDIPDVRRRDAVPGCPLPIYRRQFVKISRLDDDTICLRFWRRIEPVLAEIQPREFVRLRNRSEGCRGSAGRRRRRPDDTMNASNCAGIG